MNLDIIFTAITNNDVPRVISCVSALNVVFIAKPESDMLLYRLITHALPNFQCVRAILDVFDNDRVVVDPLPAITNLLTNPHITNDVLLQCMSCYSEKIAFDYYVDIANMDITDADLAQHAFTILPNLTSEEWDKLVSITEDIDGDAYHNQALRQFFIDQAKANKQYAPKWVTSGPQFEFQPLPRDIPNTCCVIQHLEKPDQDINELIISYAMAPVSEKLRMLGHDAIYEDEAVFREYGPVNTVYEGQGESEYECSKYGGCRMLLCNEFEATMDGEDIDLMADYDLIGERSWFTGQCQYEECKTHKIQAHHYALRLPLMYGGWKGCYCSFKCLEACTNDSYTRTMIHIMKEQIMELGIRDR